MTDVYLHTVASMGTVVTIQVVGHGADPGQIEERAACVARAVEWFHRIEASCNRFDAGSEVRQIAAQVGAPVPVSATRSAPP